MHKLNLDSVLTLRSRWSLLSLLPFVLPLQETQGDHHDLVTHLVHLAAQLHKEYMSLYFQHHLKCQHSSGSCELEQLL